MKTPKLVKLRFSELVPNESNHRSAHEYFVNEAERIVMGRGILEGGQQAIDPLKISRKVMTTNGIETVVNKVVGGNRRYMALETLEVKDLAELTIPCLVYEGLTETEELDLEVVDNEHVKPGPFSICRIVERQIKLGKSQSDIAKRYGWSSPHVGNLLILTQLEPWARTAGEDGKLSASLVWQLYNSCKGKRDEKLVALSAKLVEKRETIESQGVTAAAFKFEPSNKVQALALKLLADKDLVIQVKAYETAYVLTDKAIKAIAKLDKVSADPFFNLFSTAIKPLESEKTASKYQSVIAELAQLREQAEAKLKELQVADNKRVVDELLVKEQSGKLTVEERAKLTKPVEPEEGGFAETSVGSNAETLPVGSNAAHKGQGDNHGKVDEAKRESRASKVMLALTGIQLALGNPIIAKTDKDRCAEYVHRNQTVTTAINHIIGTFGELFPHTK